MKDGTNTPNAVCNGISIGVGFQAAQIGLPRRVAPAVPPPPDPCGDGG